MVVDTKHMAVKAAILPPQKLQYGGNDMTIVSIPPTRSFPFQLYILIIAF